MDDFNAAAIALVLAELAARPDVDHGRPSAPPRPSARGTDGAELAAGRPLAGR